MDPTITDQPVASIAKQRERLPFPFTRPPKGLARMYAELRKFAKDAQNACLRVHGKLTPVMISAIQQAAEAERHRRFCQRQLLKRQADLTAMEALYYSKEALAAAEKRTRGLASLGLDKDFALKGIR